MPVKLKVDVERILWQAEGKTWHLLLCRNDSMTTAFICKGNIHWAVQSGSSLELEGDFVEYHGERQFAFTEAHIDTPTDVKAKLHYICKRTHGIGSTAEEKIWNAYGENWQTKINDALCTKILNKAQFENFILQLNDFEKNDKRARGILWLESIGCSTAMANKAFQKWEDATEGKVTQNCYCLTQIKGCGFHYVDRNIRKHFNIGDKDVFRIKSAITYVLEQEAVNGATAMECHRHLRNTAELLSVITDSEIIDVIHAMEKAAEIIVFRPQGILALAKHYTQEQIILQWFKQASTESWNNGLRIDVDKLEVSPSMEQIQCCVNAFHKRFSIINGGAGTGKTQSIKILVNTLRKYAIDFFLCAPTGKAAARLKEATGHHATTIHSMLEAFGNEGQFRLDTLEKTVVIVDEASMIDAAIMFEIIKRKPQQLILVGDQSQLPPVGAGQPFHDAINIFPDNVFTLNKCYRNAEAIYHAATAIRNGNTPLPAETTPHEQWTVKRVQDAQQAQQMICDWAEAGIIDFAGDIILCPKNGQRTGDNAEFTPATVNALNAALLKIARRKNGEPEDGRFAPGDRVINTVNTPEAKVWNGTTGTIAYVDTDEKRIGVKLDTPQENGTTLVEFSADMIPNLQHAYALTIHKAQGSQYNKVFLLALERDSFQLNKSLIYTGVTRAKCACTVIGGLNTIAKGIMNINHRWTVTQCLAEK